MKKLLILLSSFLIVTSSISNLNLSSSLKILSNNKDINLNDATSDYNKLENWHNKLSISEDATAKADYLNAMSISTEKGENSGLDMYAITFDGAKLKNMLKENIINQDVYNILSSKDTALRLTTEANAIAYNSSAIEKSQEEFHTFQAIFYIEDNKMHFVDKNNPNPYEIHFQNIKKNFNTFITESGFFNVIDRWYDFGYINVEEHNAIITQVSDWFVEGYEVEEVVNMLAGMVTELAQTSETAGALLILLTEFMLGYFKENSFSTKAIYLNLIVNNRDKIKQANNKYHSGSSYRIYDGFDPVTMERNAYIDDIEATPPIGKGTKSWTDSLSPGSYPGHEGQNNSTNYYQYDTTLSYKGYDSLWQYLNSDVTFNLNEKFESRVGVLSEYKNYNNTFSENHSSSFLKPYLNNYIKLTEIDWKNYSLESKAEIDLEISDNPWNKTIYFHFKSILANCNEVDDVYNYMYQ